MNPSIVGLVEVIRSFSFKITGDARPASGMGKYETKEFFCSSKASCPPDAVEAVMRELHGICESAVMAEAAIHSGELPAQLASTEQPKQQLPPAPDPYVVAEKPQPPAASVPVPTPGVKPSKIIADRLTALGLTKNELIESVRNYFDTEATKFSQDEYVEAFTETEKYILANGVEHFRQQLKNKLTREDLQPVDIAPPASGASLGVNADPESPLDAALRSIAALWPVWNAEMTMLGAKWCVDHKKDVAALNAFLTANGITLQTDTATVEAFLAITRHTALSTGAKVLAVAQSGAATVSEVEQKIAQMTGKNLRKCEEVLHPEVTEALNKLN